MYVKEIIKNEEGGMGIKGLLKSETVSALE